MNHMLNQDAKCSQGAVRMCSGICCQSVLNYWLELKWNTNQIFLHRTLKYYRRSDVLQVKITCRKSSVSTVDRCEHTAVKWGLVRQLVWPPECCRSTSNLFRGSPAVPVEKTMCFHILTLSRLSVKDQIAAKISECRHLIRFISWKTTETDWHGRPIFFRLLFEWRRKLAVQRQRSMVKKLLLFNRQPLLSLWIFNWIIAGLTQANRCFWQMAEQWITESCYW